MRLNRAGIVVIGRNEGMRLVESLTAAKEFGCPIIYVDSRSSDGSVNRVNEMNINVLILDQDKPINASRARNEGYKYLLENNPDLEFIHFIDGDTVFDPMWNNIAIDILSINPSLAVICCVLKEKNRHCSIFARLLEIEWRLMTKCNGKCGGNATIRVSALLSVGGYDEDLIAGADPDLYRRISNKGFHLKVVNKELAEHDARMLKLSQWWTRGVKSGFGYSDIINRYNFTGGMRSAIIWGGIIPFIFILSSVNYGFLGWVVLLLYPMQATRIYFSKEISCLDKGDKYFYCCNILLSKFPQLYGAFKYLMFKTLKVNKKAIQYKD